MQVHDIARDLLISEARNLYDIQQKTNAMMLKVIDRLADYPEARSRLQAHLSDKDKEMGTIEQILADLGEDASRLKEATLSTMP